jgi:hypothetical protein
MMRTLLVFSGMSAYTPFGEVGLYAQRLSENSSDARCARGCQNLYLLQQGRSQLFWEVWEQTFSVDIGYGTMDRALSTWKFRGHKSHL